MKTKIKQIISFALVFLIFGGCVSVEKNLPQQSSTESVTIQSTAETVVTSEIAETEIVADKSTSGTATERKETTRKATTKPVSETKEAVTTKEAATTREHTTVKNIVTTTKPTTTATAQQLNSEGIIIGIKNVRFGCDMQSVTDTFGNPSETVTETISAGGTVKSLVYAENYGEFAVFQFLNGRLFAFYTVDKNTIITDGEKSYSLRSGRETEFGNVKITVYRDSKKGDKEYALKASFNGFDYYPHELESLEGQERLLFHTTNALRAVNGIAALEYCEKASDCVRKHCKDMSSRNYFSHDTPEGVTSSQRMRSSGIEYTSCGENLAAGYLDAFGLADGWYNSSGHRKNILDIKFRYLGVCAVKGNEDYNIYAGQNYYG